METPKYGSVYIEHFNDEGEVEDCDIKVLSKKDSNEIFGWLLKKARDKKDLFKNGN